MKNLAQLLTMALLMVVAPFEPNSLWAQEPEAVSETEEHSPDGEAEAELTPEQSEALSAYQEEAQAFQDSLNPRTGVIDLHNSGVRLDMGANHYFLDKADSKRVLEDVWGNPPREDILGMIFQNDTSPYFNEYAVAITFDRTGYVSDDDAKDIDFAGLLKQMQKDTRASNAYRTENGYDPITLLGWAADPQYDAVNKRLLWAKSLKFGTSEVNTLNYNMRFLGRKGVLEFNYIADEDALENISAAMPEMAKMAEFTEGNRYEDFNPETDKVAAYGVAGLIAGGVVAKKLGLVGILLLFLKKGWFVILAVLALGRNFIMRLFTRNKGNEIG